MVQEKEYQTNRQYKDRLFRFIFGSEENRAHLLELYNALNGTDYHNPDELEITTIDDVIYMKMKNDVSFCINGYAPLFEHQSTYNPNMAFRQFEYCAKIYNKYIIVNEYDIYGSTLIKLPTPQCYVFYNGAKKMPECVESRLSDAFEHPAEGYEWTTTWLNINAGHNKVLMDQCMMLKDYADLVESIRINAMKYPKDEAIDRAVKEGSNKDGDLAEFLTKHRAEVIDMCITEYNEELHEKTLREEGKEIGRALEIYESVQEGDYGIDRGAEKLGVNVETFIRDMRNAGYLLPSDKEA